MKIAPKIILFEPVREAFLTEHDIFVEQARTRIFDNFKDEDIEKASEKKKENFFEREGLKVPYGEGVDMGDIAEDAEDYGIKFGITLYEMKSQVILATLAALYHQWEKKLRERMEHELRFGKTENELRKIFWKTEIKCIFDQLELLGWYIREESWFSKINACRLIVNVYKHGKGRSLDELKEKHPQYLKGVFDASRFFGERDEMLLSYEDLSITIEEFNEIADAFRQFWVDFPSHEDQHKNDSDIPF